MSARPGAAPRAPRALLLPGDGVGPEVMAGAERLLDALAGRGVALERETAPVGGAAIEATGAPLPPATLEAARGADLVLLGAVGGPRWEGAPFETRPEAALLALRSELGLFANLRPARCLPALAGASALRPGPAARLDMLIVRELTGGVYFGEPRGIEPLPGGGRRGVNTQVYTTAEVRRLAEVGLRLARARGRGAVSVDKANVMESGLLWREEVQALRDAEFPDVPLEHMYADNCAMQMARDPGRFSVILADNLFGDLLSDLAAALAGSIGMLPSASLGAPAPDGRRAALYEPVHGSAPDVAGRGEANPLAMMLSVAMALEWSLGAPAWARAVEAAVEGALEAGLRTPDLLGGEGAGGAGLRRVGTEEMAEAVLARLPDSV